MSSDHRRNTKGILEYALKKRELALKNVDDAIRQLLKEKEKINFNTVSQISGVSKSYLYTNQTIRVRIEELRKQQEGLTSPSQQKRELTDASKDVLISAKNKRIKDLEAENKRLKEELMRLRGKIYDNSRGRSLANKIEYHKQLQDGIDEMEASVERLREEIQQLMNQKEEIIKEF